MFAVSLCAAFSGVGCSGPQPKDALQRYRAVNTEHPPVHKIAMLPIEPGPARDESVRLIAQTIAAGLAPYYDVVMLEPKHEGIVEPGQELLVDTLLAAREQTNADALLVAGIIDYRRIEPPSVTMSLRLYSTTTGELLAAVSGTLDAANPRTERLVKKYYEQLQEADRSLYGWRTVLIAERRYAQFVAGRFLATINPETPPRRH